MGWRDTVQKAETSSSWRNTASKSDREEDGILKEVTDFAKSAASGASSLVPFSDQIIAASQTGRQVITGDVELGDIGETYQKNLVNTLRERSRLRKEQKLANAVGMTGSAVGQAIVTGGTSLVKQAIGGVAQSGGIAGGSSLAQGASPMEAARDASKSMLYSSLIIGAPQAFQYGKDAKAALASKLKKDPTTSTTLKEDYTGITKDQQADRNLAKVLRGNEKDARLLSDNQPGIAKTAVEEGIFEGGTKLKGAPLSRVEKNVSVRRQFRGNQIGAEVDDLAEVNNLNVASRLRQEADDLAAIDPVSNESKILRLNKTAEKIEQSGNDIMTGRQAFNKKNAWQKKVYTTGKSVEKTGNLEASDEKYVAEIARRAYREEIVDSLRAQKGQEAAETFEYLNKRHSDLSAIEQLAKEGQYRPSQFKAIADRVTIGALMVAGRNPALAAGFFGGRELARGTGSRAPYINKAPLNFQPAQAVAPVAATVYGSPIFK